MPLGYDPIDIINNMNSAGSVYDMRQDPSTVFTNEIDLAVFIERYSTSAPTMSFIQFSDNGRKLYGASTSHDILIYNLNTPFDLKTYTIDSSIKINSNTLTGFYFKENGTRFYTLNTTLKAIYQYNLSTPYDLNTYTFDSSLNYTYLDTFSKSKILFNDTGTLLYIADGSNHYRINLSTAWDISTITSTDIINNFTDIIPNMNNNSGTFNANGTKILFRITSTGDYYKIYELDTPWMVETLNRSISPIEVERFGTYNGYFYGSNNLFAIDNGGLVYKYKINRI